DRTCQPAVQCNHVQVRPSGKIEIALWSSPAMATLASGLDQWGYCARVGDVRGVATAETRVVLGTLLQPLADQGDLGGREGCLRWPGHDVVRVVVVDHFPEVAVERITNIDNITVHQGLVACDLNI